MPANKNLVVDGTNWLSFLDIWSILKHRSNMHVKCIMEIHALFSTLNELLASIWDQDGVPLDWTKLPTGNNETRRNTQSDSFQTLDTRQQQSTVIPEREATNEPIVVT